MFSSRKVLPAVAAVTVALVPAAAAPAEAVAPKSGAYEASLPDGKLGFKLGLLSKRIVQIKGTTTLACADGSELKDSWDVIVFGPKTNKRFTYRGDGLVLSGRFTSAKRAEGTLDRVNGDCSATGLKWKAKRARR